MKLLFDKRLNELGSKIYELEKKVCGKPSKPQNKKYGRKKMKGIKITIEELERLVARLKYRAEHCNFKSYVIVTEKQHPNGRKYIQLEQPCYYEECNSRYEIFDARR